MTPLRIFVVPLRPSMRFFAPCTAHRATALGLIKVDGSVYRWMGPAVQNRTACTQTRLEVFATTTAYQFDVGASGVQLAVNFTTPAFGLDDDAATHHDWPVTYVHFQALAADCQAHDVEVYLDTTAESVVSDNAHEVAWARTGAANLPSSLAADLFIGSTAQAFGSVCIVFTIWRTCTDDFLGPFYAADT